ncbi:MAG: hypothetical protein WEA75_04600 [Acidimicrobiia bacterium]
MSSVVQRSIRRGAADAGPIALSAKTMTSAATRMQVRVIMP